MSKRWPDKTIIGLTGNIATGKSVVMRMAAEKGALTLDADKIVHSILEEDRSMQAAIAVAFGPEVRRADGSIDRAALGAIVFSDEEALLDLERMLHPAVRERIYERVDDAQARVVVIEAIKLLEGELVEITDQVWVTRAPRKVQIERLMVCRGMDMETAATRVNAQSPQEAKVARADVVIDTDGTMADTRTQFDLAWARLPVPEEGDQADRVRKAEAPVSRTPPVAELEPRPEPVRADSKPPAGPSPQPKAEKVGSEDEDVLVRRARPSDIPGILLLIHKATEGEIQMKRTDLLMAFSERSYLLGQQDAAITTVVGWNTSSTTAVAIDQIFAHPLEAIEVTGPPLLEEIERSARELICEVVLVYLAPDVADQIRQLFLDAGYEPRKREGMPRAWQHTVVETQPDNTHILAKVLRDIRVK